MIISNNRLFRNCLSLEMMERVIDDLNTAAQVELFMNTFILKSYLREETMFKQKLPDIICYFFLSI